MSQERTTTTQVTAASIQLWLRIKLQNNNNNRGKCQEFELKILELPFIYFIHDMIPKSIQQAMFLLNNISNSAFYRVDKNPKDVRLSEHAES